LGALAILIGGCGGGPFDEPTEERQSPITVSELKGDVLGNGAGLSNRCVTDVAAAFAALPTSPSNRGRYISKGGQALPPSGAVLQPFYPFQITGLSPSIPHVQSFSRFELGDGQDDRWFAVSRAFEQVGKAGVFLVHMSDMAGADGGPLLAPGVNYSSPVPTDRATQYYYPTEGAKHPGGLQAFGHYLAVAVEAPSSPSFVDIYDFSAGFGAGARIQRVTLPPVSTQFQPERSIGGVAVTRLKDGRYLMFVLGKDSSRKGWFYVSQGTHLPSVWDPFDNFNGYDTTPQSPFGWFRSYQNVSFVTDCASQDIYLLASGNEGYAGSFADGTDYADLFRLELSPSVGVSMGLAGRRNFNPGDGGFCTFRAAATAYAGKDNRLQLYCHAHHADSSVSIGFFQINVTIDPTLKFVEYNYDGCLSTQVACGASCCGQGATCLSDACCATTNVCGSACCGGATVCKDASQSLCCDQLSVACGGVCCDLQHVCVDGTCQEPPPPPPPPPPGSCPGDVPSCSTFADCPEHFTFCQGGCCGVLH
jgi:hypothetical protein